MGVSPLKTALSGGYLTPSGEQWTLVRLRRPGGERHLGDFPFAVNNRLRTGADKGNPTV